MVLSEGRNLRISGVCHAVLSVLPVIWIVIFKQATETPAEFGAVDPPGWFVMTRSAFYSPHAYSHHGHFYQWHGDGHDFRLAQQSLRLTDIRYGLSAPRRSSR